MNRLTGKRIIVTGAATGIGKAVAAACIAEGARVVIADLNSEVGQATAHSIGAGFVTCDVSDEASVEAMIGQAVNQMGGLDGLVNNAGLQKAGPIETTSLVDWDALMAVNIRGVFLVTREAIPHLKAAGGGSIVNTEPLQMFAGTQIVASSTNIDDETVYRTTKAFWEAVKAGLDNYPWMQGVQLETAFDYLNIPLHPGAVRYYEEIGLEIPEDLRPAS